jgi:hypothetical protein
MGGIDSRREATRLVEYGGFTMVRKGRTKRKRGNVWAQLSVSACVLLLPPIVMAAGVMVFGSSPPQGQQGAVQEAAAPQAAAAANPSVSVGRRPDMRSDGATSFALASAETHPVIAERRPVAEPRPAAAQPAAAAQRAPTGQATATKDPARYVTAAPVTLVHVGNGSEQSAMVEAPPPAAAAADAPAAVPEGSPAATRMHGFHRRSRMGWHQPHPVYRVRYQRTRSLNDIFLRPTVRPSTTRRG